MNKKKICLVIPTLTGGGMERVMSELANYFNKNNFDVCIVFLLKHDPAFPIDKGISCYFPNFEYNKESSFRPIYWLRVLKYLRKTIKKIKPDTVFSIPQDYSNLTILALLGTGLPVYISDRNSPNMPVPVLMNTARKILYPLAKGIVAQTNDAKNKMLEKGIKNKNIRVIPNPIKEIKTYPKSETESEKKIVLSIGRLVREKNQLELIDIFAQINDPQWELHIVGSGPMEIVLQERINELGLAHSIILIGQVQDVDKEMAKAEIFAFTSIYEGFPNSLNEAMAYPLACVSYDCIAGPRDIIEDGVNGFLVEMGNQEEYKAKLRILMEDEAVRKKFASSAKLNRDKFSLEKIAENFLEFLLPK